MPIALPLTLDLDQHFGDWRDDLARDGFVILRGVVPPERAEAYRQRAFDWIENVGLGFDRNDPNTWKQDCMPVMKKGGMFHHSVGQEAFLWELRQEQGVIDAFAKLWGTDKLLVSFDGANVSMPGPMQDLNQPAWWHVDQDPDKFGCRCVQGLVNLNVNGPEDGGLMVLRGSHKQNQTFFTEVWNGSDGFRPMGVEAQPDFFGFTDDHMKWFYSQGCEWVKTEMQPGDLVLWDSRTAHYNVPPKCHRDRVAAYTCYAPAYLCSAEQLELKKKLFVEGKMTVSDSQGD
ncbi:hypothetical protein JCM24511_08925 [Saitozyma sp. JCM 24511]|nr:hypothetical protein JCM24511_08925 [Saitozyma sp. JCM 24511]